MEQDPLHTYLQDLKRELRRRGQFDRETLAEIESHLLESVENGRRHGLSQIAAEQEALQRFGSTKLVATTFANEKERIRPMQKILTVIALLAGLFFLYIESRPTWDDTGILVGGILLVSGLIAVIGYRRPWLLALLVGGWIALYGIFITNSSGPVVALVIAFIGAYAGWFFNMAIRKMLQPA